MYNSRDDKSGQKARHCLAGHLAKRRAQAAARAALESLTHYVHAEQKQAQPAYHLQRVKYVHKLPSLTFYNSFYNHHFSPRLSNQ